MTIALEINREKLAEVAAESISKINPEAQDGQRWINAIAKAVVEIERNPYMSYSPDTKTLLVVSETSGNTYQANGTCQCKAFENGFPCRHRAAARLVQRYVEKFR